jgi:HPt (histidine-containing phosphotransfer) domain-containing protein
MTRLVDWRKALEHADGSEELLLELAQVFVETCPDMLADIRQAIDEGSADDLNRAAHNLKGAARIFAAGPVVELALQLEETGASGSLAGAAEHYADLERCAGDLRAVLSQRLGRTGAGQNNGA